MTDSIVGKRVNVFMLLLVLLITLLMIGTALFYQEIYAVLNARYSAKSSNLTACMQDLAVTDSMLAQVSTSLNSTQADLQKYDQLYQTKKQELEDRELALTDELAMLRRNLTNMERQYILIADTLAAQLVINANLTQQAEACDARIQNATLLLELKNTCLLDTPDDSEEDCLALNITE